MRRFLIDTDTASDDAVALVMALRHADINVEAITVVSGNVGRDQAVQNALYTVELCGADVPIYAGAAKPMMRPLQPRNTCMAKTGWATLVIRCRARVPVKGRGADVIVETIPECTR